jgi:hypothetical protein
MSKIVARLLPLLLFLFQFGPASAQQSAHAPNLKLGDVVVTGFSGTRTPEDATRRSGSGKSAIDFTFINPDGPSARIIDVSGPDHVWDGRLLATPKSFDVLAKDIGQVFGVALDDQSPPNLYVAATSAYGLNIVIRGRDGLPERRKKGSPGAGWMAGQFGLDLQGGPGGIYRIDGRTGVATLFANVTLDGVPNPGPGLGNLAYDAAHKQIFVSDLYTGMIHRFDLNGKELGHYDHGVTALPMAKLAAIAFDPKRRPDIASASFDSENPDTWGFAPPTRRVWGLAVHEGRLYYSARNGSPTSGPQIWSVGIQADGGFAADARWELDVSSEPGPYAVSDIAFSHQGAMILAQRAPIAGAYDYSAFTAPGDPRVLRYWPTDSNNPASPSRWKLVPEEYAVGFAGDYRNTNGGVALGYGYSQDGTLRAGACEAALWTTGQNLRNNPALRGQLEPGGPLVVHGLQGSPADLVRNANTPPTVSYFIDYDGTFHDPRAAGHIGSVRVYATPCAPAAYVQPASNATPVAAPGGACVGPNCRNVCMPTCICPPGSVLEGKECVKRSCPDGEVFNPATGACGCPRGTVLRDGKCVPEQPLRAACTPPMIQVPGGPCMCPQGTVLVDGQCVAQTRECRPPLVLGPDGTCICPRGTTMQGGKCVAQVCPSPLVPGPCRCPEGTVQDSGLCVQVGRLIVKKEVTARNTAIPLPAGTLFPMTVTCTPPLQTWSFSLTANGSHTVTNIPFGSTCTVSEVPPAFPPNLCPRGTVPAWVPPPFSTPASVVISGTTATMVMHNTVTCKERTGSLSVTKKVAPDPRGIGGSLIFPMTVTCANPTGSYPLTVHGNTSTVPHNLPVGSHCTVTETQPPLPAGCTWLAPTFSPAGVTIAGGLNQETVTNGYRCQEVCPPPQVMNAAGVCGCPPPMVPGAVAGTCICPLGSTLVGGKCVPVNSCQPPLVMIPGAGCGCANGEVLVGKECVRRIVCKPPLMPNSAGTGCVCRDGLVLRGGKCVEVEKPKREKPCKRGYIWNGDMCVRRKTEPREKRSRELPGIRTPGRLPGTGGGAGGRDGTPGKR